MDKLTADKTKQLLVANDISHREMNSKTLKELRAKLCLTQSEMGEKLGVSRSAIAKYEAGMNMREPVIRLAEQLEVKNS